MGEFIKENWDRIIVFLMIVGCFIGVFALLANLGVIEDIKKIAEWGTSEHHTSSNIYHLSDGYDPEPPLSSTMKPKESSSKCPLIGRGYCIVEEWEPACVWRKCIIDTRQYKDDSIMLEEE